MKTSKIIAGSMLILILIVAITGCGSSSITQSSPSSTAMVTTTAPATSSANTVTSNNAVAMTGYAYQPAELTINKDETVTWTNQDSAKHDVVGSNFKSSLFGKGESFSQTFNETGTFDYKCSIHPNMIGKIIVK